MSKFIYKYCALTPTDFFEFNYIDAEKTTDYGARVKKIHDKKLWIKQKFLEDKILNKQKSFFNF